MRWGARIRARSRTTVLPASSVKLHYMSAQKPLSDVAPGVLGLVG